MNEETSTPEPQTTPQSAETRQVESSPPKLQPPDPRRRLRELLAIPERDRTDAMWDELVELEIQTAPGNRALPPQVSIGQGQEQRRKPDQVKRQDSNNRNRPGNRFANKRRRAPAKPV